MKAREKAMGQQRNETEGESVQAIDHGGNLARASMLFPQAPQPWIDLSTGINAHSYPHSAIPATAFSRLPEPAALERLKAVAAIAYGVPTPANLAAAPGTHILLPLIIEATFGSLPVKNRRAVILSPTYAEHARLARHAGFEVVEAGDFDALEAADLAIVVNPNNPDGRLIPPEKLLGLSRKLAAKRGLLLVDEAFMEVIEPDASVASQVHPGLIVLRSFGKFYGLAGLRLGFAVAPPAIADQLGVRLGPWAIPGPTLHAGLEALADRDWQDAMRSQLKSEAERLDTLLVSAGVQVAGGTSLFRFVVDPRAQALFRHLGEEGILVRRFAERPDCLRIGLPQVDEWNRLETVLCTENWQS
jgi:cobalamin biosynthesis protein CobC